MTFRRPRYGYAACRPRTPINPVSVGCWQLNYLPYRHTFVGWLLFIRYGWIGSLGPCSVGRTDYAWLVCSHPAGRRAGCGRRGTMFCPPRPTPHPTPAPPPGSPLPGCAHRDRRVIYIGSTTSAVGWCGSWLVGCAAHHTPLQRWFLFLLPSHSSPYIAVYTGWLHCCWFVRAAHVNALLRTFTFTVRSVPRTAIYTHHLPPPPPPRHGIAH